MDRPKCGAQFVTKNLWHSCVRGIKIKDRFARSEPQVLDLFHRVEKMLRQCGSLTRIVQKTRVTFTVRVRFVSVYPRKSHFLAGFFFKKNIRHSRFAKIEKFPGNSWVNTIEIKKPADLDDQLRQWIEEAYAVGEQQYLLEQIK